WVIMRSQDGGSTFQSFTSATGASFSLTPNLAGIYRVTLTATDKDGGVSSADVLTITAVDPVVASINLTGDAQSATIGQPYGNALVATVLDQLGNPLAGRTVNFTLPSSGPGGALSGLT